MQYSDSLNEYDYFNQLPAEILAIIFNLIRYRKGWHSLFSVCKRFYDVLKDIHPYTGNGIAVKLSKQKRYKWKGLYTNGDCNNGTPISDDGSVSIELKLETLVETNSFNVDQNQYLRSYKILDKNFASTVDAPNFDELFSKLYYQSKILPSLSMGPVTLPSGCMLSGCMLFPVGVSSELLNMSISSYYAIIPSYEVFGKITDELNLVIQMLD